MPVEQGLPWHPVATGLAGQAIPFVVAAFPAHALPSPPFWFPVPAVLVASPASLCPSSLSAVLALVPPGVAPAFCVSVLLLPLSVGAPGCPCRATPPVPPACPRVQGFHISVRRGLSCAQLAGHGPVATPVAGTSQRRVQPPPLWSMWAPCRGRGGGGVADGSLGMRRIWWLLQCPNLMVPFCIVVCPIGARLTAMCGAALCPVAFLPISGSFFFCWHAHRCWCAAPGGGCLPLWLPGCPICSWVVPRAPPGALMGPLVATLISPHTGEPKGKDYVAVFLPLGFWDPKADGVILGVGGGGLQGVSKK